MARLAAGLYIALGLATSAKLTRESLAWGLGALNAVNDLP